MARGDGRPPGRPPGAAAFAPEVEAAVATSRGPRRGRRAWIRDRGRPAPRRRAARRMLRRLDGMGKYGGYHTEFRHLARGFAGHERALALEVGEALCAPGYLAEKPSVGQRHVSLVAARTSDIRALVERGTCEEPLGAAQEPARLNAARKRDWPRSKPRGQFGRWSREETGSATSRCRT